MAASETPTALETCPTDEDLAAYLDGRLAAPERARITAHLADCESCYEIFAGAAHFQQDVQDEISEDAAHFQQDNVPAEPAGRIVAFPPPEDGGGRARKRWWIPAAAAAALAIGGVGFIGYRSFSTELMTPELIALLQTEAALASHLHHFTTYRGIGDDSEAFLSRQPSFLAGARLVDLQISLDTGKDKEASELLRGIGQSIRSGPLGDKDESAKLYLDAAEQLRAGGPGALGKIKAAAPRWEEGLKDSLLDPDFLAFGKWTEAGRLAAETGSSDFFNRRNRHFLSVISRTLEEEQKGRGQASSSPDDFDAEAERDDAALAELRAIAAIWDGGDLKAADYAKLAEHFGMILQRYDV
jgi:hypothetical protein